jgi:hypothetical protein
MACIQTIKILYKGWIDWDVRRTRKRWKDRWAGSGLEDDDDDEEWMKIYCWLSTSLTTCNVSFNKGSDGKENMNMLVQKIILALIQVSAYMKIQY